MELVAFMRKVLVVGRAVMEKRGFPIARIW